jgi:hypothetical protein
MAKGADGVFANGAPWVLTSASVNFATNGVAPNQVVALTSPKAAFPGGGDFLAIDSVSSNSITLRRAHKDLNVGQPPSPLAGLTNVAFSITTFDPQIEEASFDIKRRFGIDENLATRNSSWVYDLRDLRMLTVLTVLYDRYTAELRSDKGDWQRKMGHIRNMKAEVLERVSLRWGPLATSAETSSPVFGLRVSR